MMARTLFGLFAKSAKSIAINTGYTVGATVSGSAVYILADAVNEKVKEEYTYFKSSPVKPQKLHDDELHHLMSESGYW